jgi:uncharacterized membrane protein YbhN (UPF0104 family)
MMRVVQAFSLQRALLFYGRPIKFESSLALSGLKGLFNLGFTGLGIAVQSAEGHIKHLVPAGVIIFANALQVFLLSAALGFLLLFALLIFSTSTEVPAPILLLVVAIVFLVTGLVGAVASVFPGLVTWLPHVRRFPGRRFVPSPSRDLAGSTLIWIGTLQSSCVLLRLSRVLVIAWGIDPNVDVEMLAISVLAADTIGVIPITPGGIGIRELLIGAIGAASRHYELLLAAAVIDRMATIFLNILHGAVAIWRSGAGRQTP